MIITIQETRIPVVIVIPYIVKRRVSTAAQATKEAHFARYMTRNQPGNGATFLLQQNIPLHFYFQNNQ
jgi:hypothetical protein